MAFSGGAAFISELEVPFAAACAGPPATTRASFALYNTEAEVDALMRGVAKVQEMFA